MFRNLMRRRWFWLPIATLVVLVAAYKLLVTTGIITTRAGTTVSKDRQRPVLVMTATARKSKLEVYLKGLGTVTPVNTVLMKSQVSGQLMQIYYKEGQLIKAGEVLAELYKENGKNSQKR